MSEMKANFMLRRKDFVLDASFSLPLSGVTVIAGVSGAGKTTLLRSIAGLERSVEGFFSVGDASPWLDSSRGIRTSPQQRSVGYVFQDARLFPHLSVRGNIEFGCKPSSVSSGHLTITEIVAALGLETLLSRDVQTLSGGERQRVAIARALLSSPSLLLMDEPVSALDIDSRSEVLSYLERLLAGFSVPLLYVCHSVDEMARLATRVLYMSAGRVDALLPLAEALSSERLPFASSREAVTVLEGKVQEKQPSFGLSLLRTPAGLLTIPGLAWRLGEAMRFSISASDVSIALEPPRQSSVLNILPAVVESLRVHEPQSSYCLVLLRVGGATLLARITRKSAAALQLKSGNKVFALVKSVALLR